MSSKWLVILFMAFSSAATAQQSSSALLFERENIRITAPTGQGVPAHPPLTFNAEVRSEDALRLEYIHTLNNLTDDGAVIVALTSPSIMSLPALRVPTPVDTLFVDNNGMVVQILPNTVLADLTREIAAKTPIKAFMFLKAGAAQSWKIKPKDVITASPFNPAPPVME